MASQVKLNYYEFFAGVGMARKGLDKDWRCIWANDFDVKKAETYVRNYGSDELVVEDIARIRHNDLPEGAVLAWASFPCQDLSLAGNGGGITAGRSGTFWAFWNLMKDMAAQNGRPPMIVLENVIGLLKPENFIALCEALASLGLQFGALVMDAKRFLPQSRPRVFVVAVDIGIDCSEFYSEHGSASKWTNESVFNAFSALPKSLQAKWRWWNLPDHMSDVISVDQIIEEEPVGVEWNSDEETERMLAMMTEMNRRKVNECLRLNKRSIGFLYKRTRNGQQRAEVRFDGIAGCLRTPKGGSSRQSVMIVENGEVRTRLLSPRELARLMGMPEQFVLPNEYNAAYMAMGDGVAVPCVSWLSDHLLTPLAKKIALMEPSHHCDVSETIEIHLKNAEDLAKRWGSAVNA
ncbi:DNA cytosine methyltransferase [Paenibacillus sp. CAU 1782]